MKKIAVLFSTIALGFFISFQISDFLTGLIDGLFSKLSSGVADVIENELLQTVLCNGLIPGIGIVISFLPSIFLIFLVTESLSRAKYFQDITNYFSDKLIQFNLPKQAMLPMLNSIGCTIPAYVSTRIIKSKRERFLSMIAISFIPCRAKMMMFIIFCSAFFNRFVAPFVLFLIYAIGTLTGLYIAKFSAKFKNIQPRRFNCQGCKVGDCSFYSDNFIFSLLKSCINFVKETFTTLIIVSVLFGFFSHFPLLNKENFMKICTKEYSISDCNEKYKMAQMEESWIGLVGKKMEVITKPIGFNWQLNTALLVGTSGKEAVISALGVLYADNKPQSDFSYLKNQIPFASAISFVVFMIFYIPCTSAMATLFNETKNFKFTLAVSLGMIVLAWVMSFLSYNFLTWIF